ncbi:MAG TPA: RHS repeat-associated core domain-containing protein, partial [Burkholderiaceae bacterium]|nr:RHS repeat-associated core domain-containing protein [Burkholderiaceae bacterium]
NVTTNDGQTRTQVYSLDGQLLYGVMQSGASAQTERYVYLGGKAIAQTNSAGGTTYLHTDALGSVVATVGNASAQVSYSCASGWTLSGNTCSQSTTTTVAATVSGYGCPSGYTLSGSTCSKTTTTSSAATATYSCPSGWTLSGTNCTTNNNSPATPVYACPSGWTLSGSTCSGTTSSAASINWDCKGHGSLQPYASSPSGYYCAVYTVSTTMYNNPKLDYRGEVCADKAESWGLAWVGQRANGTSYVDCLIGPVNGGYYCPSGQTLSGSSCIAPATQAASVIGYTCSAGTVSGSNCVTVSTAAASVSYSCPSGQTLSGTSCIASSTASTPGMPIYSCATGYTLLGTNCTQQGTATTAATASFSCPGGGALSSSTCLGVLKRTRYEAYGNTAAGEVRKGLGFTGHVNDSDTGLVYMQQRYYDPIAARFMSVDPIVTDANTGGGFNLYEYAQSNPYRYTDPDGREEQAATTTTKVMVTGSNIPATIVTNNATGNVVSTTNAGISPTTIVGGRPLTGSGHHVVPNQTVKALGITSPAALEVFDSPEARIPVENHNGARPSSNTVSHDEYNRLATREGREFMNANKIDPAKMSGEQAKAMLHHFKTGADPQIRQFNQVQFSRALQQAIQKAWYRAPIKAEE